MCFPFAGSQNVACVAFPLKTKSAGENSSRCRGQSHKRVPSNGKALLICLCRVSAFNTSICVSPAHSYVRMEGAVLGRRGSVPAAGSGCLARNKGRAVPSSQRSLRSPACSVPHVGSRVTSVATSAACCYQGVHSLSMWTPSPLCFYSSGKWEMGGG